MVLKYYHHGNHRTNDSIRPSSALREPRLCNQISPAVKPIFYRFALFPLKIPKSIAFAIAS
jgi:hypothetical protein